MDLSADVCSRHVSFISAQGEQGAGEGLECDYLYVPESSSVIPQHMFPPAVDRP